MRFRNASAIRTKCAPRVISINRSCFIILRGVKGSFIVPLSSSLCLELGVSEQPLEFVPLSVDQVHEVNEIIAHCADRRILGSNFDDLDQAFLRAPQ